MSSAKRTTTDQDVLVAGISAIMGVPLQLRLSTRRSSVDQENVSLLDYHDKTYSYGQVGDGSANQATNTKKDLNTAVRQIEIYAKMSSGKEITVNVDPNVTVEHVTNALQNTNEVLSNEGRVVFAGKTLTNEKRLHEYGIQDRCTLHVLTRTRDGAQLVLDPASMDPQYDHDFTRIKDNNRVFTRGSMPYVRPCGWKRFAIKVSDKFENMVWLGDSDKNGEWPVSYHGTGFHQARTIAIDGFELTKGKTFAFQYGVYSTPDLEVAERYAVKFSHGNIQYLIILQNRVNPKTLLKVSNNQTNVDEYWVNPSDKDVRPYGICIKKL
ncbi:unnamed protein product [Adineta ricciae]|uniref:Ubiquitin-like domain-containing protein n=1 Tax=Adineta ricciae TaxID=249248 RepID=A0A813TJ81_ADIRI|nr:unnamed protein product [Adineta ricciae]CAF1380105.1 unnamed protein product [Adineta ricciae]